MSRYVLTEVLLDFGRSLWRSADIRGEWSGLSASGFEAIGQFGIGFFSVFMLGEQVHVITRRYDPKAGEAPQWLLDFTAGTSKRPILRTPTKNEKLKRHGTRVSVLISQEKLDALCPKKIYWQQDSPRIPFVQSCARLAPALDMDLYVRNTGETRQLTVRANDWLTLLPHDLLRRVAPGNFENESTDKFGLWTYMSELRNSDGNVIGRCAVQPFMFMSNNYGVGVVKGLLAGPVPEIAGILLSKPQNDLARKESLPDVLLSEVQCWAEQQKQLLFEHGKLDAKLSSLLAFFGASYTGLVLGKFGGQFFSYEEFIDIIRETDEIIVHDGEVDYDDDDDVLKKEFDDFEADVYLLELFSRRPPSWLDQIDDDNVSRKLWSLESALESALTDAWGQVDWDADNVVIGFVNGTSISRSCRIAKRIEE